MKRLTYLSIVIAFLMGVAVTFDACKKEEANQAPSCKITAPTNGQEIAKGETVTISVEASDGDGIIVEVRFFVDGVGKASKTSFPYNYNWNTSSETIETHTITARSIDNSGGSNSDEISIEIIQGGSADFNADQTSGLVSLTVHFTDLSTNNPTSWQWDFGDGSTSTQQNSIHTYNNTGTYTVTLTATNSYGSDTETKTNYIVVFDGGGDTFTDPRDGQTYNIVIIGSQTWFAENLNYETGNSWCYNSDPANCEIYGRLYDWETVMNGEESSNQVPSGVQGICSDGWHLPSDNEWKILEGNVDTQYGVGDSEWDGTSWRGYDAGKRLKTTTGWDINTGTDAVGFSALAGGYRSSEGDFYSLDTLGFWWSATELYSGSSWFRTLYYGTDEVARGTNRGYVFSVRCVRD